MFENLTLNKRVQFDLLIKYGFNNDDFYYYETNLLDDFILKIIIDNDGIINIDVLDKADLEPYILYKVNNSAFSKIINSEIEKIIKDIIDKAYVTNVFNSPQAIRIINYVKENYDSEPEFLWKKFKGYAAIRRKDNLKWFMTIMKIPLKKLNVESDKMVEVINLKVKDENILELLKIKGIYPGWHMNKSYWYTIILDETFSDIELFKKIDKSFDANK